MKELTIAASDGDCPAWFYTPAAAEGPLPGVILLMDGPGIRPAVHDMARRLADSGFAVLLPDLFYRSGPYEPVVAKVVFSDKALKEQHRERFMAKATPKGFKADFPAYVAALHAQDGVKPGPVGVTGYCMGGRLAMIAAGAFPDDVGAAASFHGGGLANDTPTSPHLLAGQIKGKILVAGATDDGNFDDEQKARLDQALSDAGVDYRLETWPAHHGWVPADTAVHDPEQAERHWRELPAFLHGGLG
jgi:carboxymethylenebutenolidase